MVTEYTNRRPLYLKFTECLREILEGTLKGIPNVLQSRTKEMNRFARKVALPERHYETLEMITDLTALRVLTYSLGDADKVRKVIESTFDVDWPNTVDKRKELKPNQIGYSSINYVVSLLDTGKVNAFVGLKGEIQVDTLLSHVWSETQHPLYKQEETVPQQLERRLFLVKALLEVADLELQEFKDRETDINAEIKMDVDRKVAVPVSASALLEFVEESDEVQMLVASASKAGFDIMSSLEGELNIVSDLAQACVAVSIRTVNELENFLRGKRGRAEKFLKNLGQQISATEGSPWSVGGAYLVLFVLIVSFPKILNNDFFAKRKWAPSTLRLIRKSSSK